MALALERCSHRAVLRVIMAAMNRDPHLTDPSYRRVPAPATREKALARLHSPLNAFAELPVRLAQTPDEWRQIRRFLRCECKRLDVPLPEYLQ